MQTKQIMTEKDRQSERQTDRTQAQLEYKYTGHQIGP